MTATATPSLTPEQLTDSVNQAWIRFIEADRRAPYKAELVYASAYEECERKMVLGMTSGDQAPQWSAEQLANFRRGKDRERDLKADLAYVGRNCNPPFEVVGTEEKFELRDRKGRVVIRGKVDCRIKFPGGRSYPVEIKSWNPNLVARVERFEDLLGNRWTRRGAHQLLCYEYGANEELGFMLLDRPGLPMLLPVELFPNADRIDAFLDRAERAMDHKAAGTLPDFIDDPAECKYCQFFGSACNPPLSYPAASVFVDDETIENAERLVELEAKLNADGLDEYEKLDKWAKKRFRGVELAIAGGTMIQGKWQKDTKYDLPDDVKSQIEALKTPHARVEAKGKFFLTITKVSQ